MTKLLLSFLLLLTTPLFSRYTQTCKVEYETQDGWSDYYTVNVIFSSGYELNNATKTINYDVYAIYGVIFWAKGEASVIKLKDIIGCGFEVDGNCIANHIGNIDGFDQRGIEWNICVTGYCY